MFRKKITGKIKKGGGVSIYIKENIEHFTRKDKDDERLHGVIYKN